jgi:hypothetical protein
MKEVIRIEWHWQDVFDLWEVTEDKQLDYRECCEILEIIEKTHDCNQGINWTVIEEAIRAYKDNKKTGKDSVKPSPVKKIKTYR